jgi:serine carboxypeptidase-like clade I
MCRYVGVEDATGAELFYYFVESERSPATDAVLLWLSGGPRCSVLCGLAFEIGPVKFIVKPYDGTLPQLVVNPNSWTQVCGISLNLPLS